MTDLWKSAQMNDVSEQFGAPLLVNSTESKAARGR